MDCRGLKDILAMESMVSSRIAIIRGSDVWLEKIFIDSFLLRGPSQAFLKEVRIGSRTHHKDFFDLAFSFGDKDVT